MNAKFNLHSPVYTDPDPHLCCVRAARLWIYYYTYYKLSPYQLPVSGGGVVNRQFTHHTSNVHQYLPLGTPVCFMFRSKETGNTRGPRTPL
jgi:hypothetical protein